MSQRLGILWIKSSLCCVSNPHVTLWYPAIDYFTLRKSKDFSVNTYLKVDLQITPDALKIIASQALEKKTGARGLRAILVSCTQHT